MLSKNQPIGVSPRGLRVKSIVWSLGLGVRCTLHSLQMGGATGHIAVEFSLHSGTGHSGDAEHKHQHQHKTSGSGRRRRSLRRRRGRKKEAAWKSETCWCTYGPW